MKNSHFFSILIVLLFSHLFAESNSGDISNDSQDFGGEYYNEYYNEYTNEYSSEYKSEYSNIYFNLYDNNYGKKLKIVTENGIISQEEFVEYFSDWQWSGQKQDFFSYAENRSAQEKQLTLCYNEALKKFKIGTAIIATTWIVSFVVPGGTIYQVAIITIAEATTKGALLGGAIGAISSAGISYLQGKRGDELIYATINGAATGYLVGAITGVVQGTISAVQMIKDAPKYAGNAGDIKTILNGKVYDVKGKEIGKYLGEYPEATIKMDRVGTVYKGIPYEWQLVNDSKGNFYHAVMPRFEGPTIKMTESLQFAGRNAHYEFVKEVLQTPQLCAKNGISQKKAEYILNHWNEFTVHHLGERNMLQIVDAEAHSLARHTGGISMWGK